MRCLPIKEVKGEFLVSSEAQYLAQSQPLRAVSLNKKNKLILQEFYYGTPHTVLVGHKSYTSKPIFQLLTREHQEE